VVDFNKRLSGKKASKPVDPVALYDTLDRAHDKGPLRPAQIAVLTAWFTQHQATRDVSSSCTRAKERPSSAC
jgi:hypothetical protein